MMPWLSLVVNKNRIFHQNKIASKKWKMKQKKSRSNLFFSLFLSSNVADSRVSPFWCLTFWRFLHQLCSTQNMQFNNEGIVVVVGFFFRMNEWMEWLHLDFAGYFCFFFYIKYKWIFNQTFRIDDLSYINARIFFLLLETNDSYHLLYVYSKLFIVGNYCSIKCVR